MLSAQKYLLVLPRPSRFDRANDTILAGTARALCDATLPAGYGVCYFADLAQHESAYTHIVLTGQECCPTGTNLHHLRGYVYRRAGRSYVHTYWPQDAVDIKDYEGGLDTDDDDAGNGKDDAPTRRSNYRFWFQRDVAKLGNPPETVPSEPLRLLTSAQLVSVLNQIPAGAVFYFDIESNPKTNTLVCFSFAWDNSSVFTALIYDHNERLVPGAHTVMAALAKVFARVTLVAHNVMFDMGFLALFHGIPPARTLEDTMLMGHRIWPEAEKSLAHAISLWTNEPYHKDQGGNWDPRSWDQCSKLLRYNARDVLTLRAVYRAQWRYVAESGDAGLRASVVQVNAIIWPYLYAGFHGIPINTAKLLYAKQRQERAVAVWKRIITILISTDINPNSGDQIADYFERGMKYPVLARTESGKSATDEATLYKYLLSYPNPAIRAILKYKRAAKVASTLSFRWFAPLKKR